MKTLSPMKTMMLMGRVDDPSCQICGLGYIVCFHDVFSLYFPGPDLTNAQTRKTFCACLLRNCMAMTFPIKDY